MPPPVARKFEPLPEFHFHLREVKQNEWLAVVFKEVSIEDVLRRDFWTHVAHKLRFPDKIIVVREDKGFYLELVVFSSYGTSVDVRPLCDPITVGDHMPLVKPEEDYYIADGGEIRGWQVIRRKDNKVIKGDGKLRSESEAMKWMSDWLKATGKR
jgi:hypothetical protein